MAKLCLLYGGDLMLLASANFSNKNLKLRCLELKIKLNRKKIPISSHFHQHFSIFDCSHLEHFPTMHRFFKIRHDCINAIVLCQKNLCSSFLPVYSIFHPAFFLTKVLPAVKSYCSGFLYGYESKIVDLPMVLIQCS